MNNEFDELSLMSDTTRLIVVKLNTEIQSVKDRLASSGLFNLKSNDELVREYSRKVGYLEGLQFIQKLIEEYTKGESDD